MSGASSDYHHSPQSNAQQLQQPPASSATPPVSSSGPGGGPPQHKRVYQACIPCRRRKVKCDLGSVDNPSSPPCVRCRRESKECFFSATRRKRKSEADVDKEALELNDDYVVRNGRKRVHIEGVGPAYVDEALMVERPLTPGGHLGRSQPLRRPQINDASNRNPNLSDESNTQLENPEAQDVMRQEIYGLTDALDLLYKAATNGPTDKRGRSESSTQQTPLSMNNPVGHHQSTPLNHVSQPPLDRAAPPKERRETVIDPALRATRPYEHPDRIHDPGYKDAVRMWSRFRFVRAGWFTPAEAIDYIGYYYEYLSPLTPISPPTFRDPGTHRTLLLEEPILTITLLTIATRYKQIPGPGGHCRSHAIHEQLWNHLRGMIERCLWGQEAFGHGMYGVGLDPEAQTSSTAPTRGLRKGSLRTLGTIESLMILTEWHPRALHFPPQEATDELMLPLYEEPDTMSTDDDNNNKIGGGVGGKRIESWLEPAWRSDRMCWMLLANAWGLSHELGVFDQMDDATISSTCDTLRPEYEDEGYRLRAQRIRKLLVIYITQLAGRLGWTNMVPEFNHEGEIRRRRQSNDGNTPGTTTTASAAFNYIPDLELDDQIILCWGGITNAMHIGNQRLFRSRKHTTDIIQSGAYIELLKDFQPMLKQWMVMFEGYRLPPYIRHILTIEYEYVRIYVNSLSLQAVVERSGSGNQPLSPETQSYYGRLPLARLGGFGAADQAYIREVIDGSRNLLRTVVDGLLPGGYLKHAPVRTYFRIISGAMFLLKTFALGASKSDVEVSIGLMDRAVDALRNCVVDDVHLGIRFADLLETLTSRLRNRFMHAPTAASSSKANGSDKSTAPLNPDVTTAPAGTDGSARSEWATPNAGDVQSSSAGQPDNNISATPYDLTASSFYATPSVSNGLFPDRAGVPAADDGQSWDKWGGAGDLWYLPPGAAFFQNHDHAITMTSEGVNVGGMDLLEYMAMDQFPSMEGSNNGLPGSF